MKNHRLNPGISIIILSVISFLGTLLFFRFQELFYEFYSPKLTLFGSIISLLLLLGLCYISARIMLWTYSKIQVPQHPKKILAYGFLISASSVFLSMWAGFQQYQLLLTVIPDLPLSTGYINFFRVGFEPVLLTCAIITIVLLWIARWRKRNDGTTISGGRNTWMDAVLITSTLVTLVFFIRSVFKFIMITMSIWALGR